MIELPKRKAPIYKEIEAFETYEFTNCIAYEMAIRNNEVKRLFNFIKTNDNLRWNIKSKDIKRIILGKYPKLNNHMVVDEIKRKLLNKYLIKYDYKQLTSDLFFVKFPKKFAELLSNQILIGKHRKESYQRNYFQKEGFTIEQLYNATKKDFDSSISPNFKRYIHNSNSKLENINLNLPKDELIAYISKIKDTYDNDNSIIKTPLELLGEDLDKANNKKMNKTNAEKYADWFYIYDCYQILKADNKKKSNETIYSEIDLLLLEHYDLIDDDDYYSIETYKKTIMKNMKYLIDELGYKELITGVKNK